MPTVSTPAIGSLYQNMANLELFPVGFPVLMNRFADPNLRANTSIATKMKMVDIIPTGFLLNFNTLMGGGPTDTDIQSDWLKYDFDFYIKEYRRKLKAIGIPNSDSAFGVRLWITGDSQGSDTISNRFTENAISSMINNQVQNAGIAKARKYLRSVGISNLISGFASGTSQASRAIQNVFLDGRHVSLPNTWQDSSYTTNYQFTVKLSSPYGSHKAIQKFIAEPLLRLICIASASSSDGITYGLPPYLFVRAYGVAYLKLAIPESLNIIRGNEDRINKDRQPLDIIVTLSTSTAIPGFAALTGSGDSTIPDLNNPGITTQTAGMKEDILFDQMADENVYDWDTFGYNINDSSGGQNMWDTLLGRISSTKTGPALNTVGGILKSLMPSPPFLSNVIPYNDFNFSNAGGLFAMLANPFIQNSSNSTTPVSAASDVKSNNYASAPVLNDQFRTNIEDVGLGSVMNPFLDKLVG